MLAAAIIMMILLVGTVQSAVEHQSIGCRSTSIHKIFSTFFFKTFLTSSCPDIISGANSNQFALHLSQPIPTAVSVMRSKDQ